MTILKKLVNFLLNQNVIAIPTGNYIDSSNKLKGVVIKGRIEIGKNNIIKFAEISGNVTIGNYNTLNGPNLVLISQVNSITIGNFCSIARDIIMQEYNHPISNLSSYYIGKNIIKKGHREEMISKGPIQIGNDVWIGAKSIILSGVNIGDGAIIAAGSVVTKSVPAYAIVGGNPAKVIKYRFQPEMIDLLLVIKWWTWDIEKIKKNQHLFLNTLTLQNLKEFYSDYER